MTSSAPRFTTKLTTLLVGLCAGAVTYWIWRRVLGVPLELSTSIHMDDPTFRLRPWAPWWVAPLIVGVLIMGFWRVLVARRGRFSMKTSMLVMAAAVPVAFAVSFMCLNYGAMMQSPLISFAKLVQMTPLVVVEGVSLAAFNLAFSWILLLPVGLVGLAIAGIGRLCGRLEQHRGDVAQADFSQPQRRTDFGRRTISQTTAMDSGANGSSQLLRLTLAAGSTLAVVLIAAGVFRFAQNASFDTNPLPHFRKDSSPQNNHAPPTERDRADKGDVRAQFGLGLLHEKGLGVDKDYDEAIKWYRKAAAQGHAPAQDNLGNMYAQGRGVAQDYAEAFKWHRMAGEQGDAAAQTNVGLAYEKGLGVAQDYAQSVEWYRRAADQGHAVAQTRLGIAYQNGRGLDQDYAEAVKWYRTAAEQGYPLAQNNLGAMYSRGLGVTQDYHEARKWLVLAADQGNALAQLNLGNTYANGLGVSQDYAEAAKWYRKAAAQGNSLAEEKLQALLAEAKR